MISYKMARRSFLRNCGGGAALLAPLLRGIEARAQGIKAPLKFLVIHHPLGTILEPTDMWRPVGAPTATTMLGPNSLGPNSAPFAPLLSKMVMIDGLNIESASRVAGNSGGNNTHEGGMVALMTGVPTLGQIGTQDHAAGGPSFDQLLLAQSPVLGGGVGGSAKTPFGSLQLAADIRSDRDEIAPRILSYLPPTNNTNIALARQPLFSETQPLMTFNRLFGMALPTGTTAATALAQKLSVLDFMKSDLARLQKLIPASEKPKLLTHADAIQKLEASLRAQLAPAGMTGGSVCVKPAAPAMFNQSGLGAHDSVANVPVGGTKLSGVDYYDPSDPNNHPHLVLGRLQLSMIRAAFACDLVRVATFMWSAGTNWVVFPGTMGGKSLPGNVPNPHHPPSHTTDPATVAWLAQIDTLYSQQTSAALQEFVAQADVDGGNLLDNTIVSYVTEVGRAADHAQTNVPYLVFGGANTGIQGGKYIKVTDGPRPSRTTSTGNRPTNDVWLALAPKFGVTLPALGNRGTQYTGPLPGLIV